MYDQHVNIFWAEGQLLADSCWALGALNPLDDGRKPILNDSIALGMRLAVKLLTTCLKLAIWQNRSSMKPSISVIVWLDATQFSMAADALDDLLMNDSYT